MSQILDSLQNIDSVELDQINYDSLLEANNLSETISFDVDTNNTKKERKKNKAAISLNGDGGNMSFDFSDFKTVKKYRYDVEYSNAQLLDTLGVDADSISEFRYTTFYQAMKLYRSNAKIITKFFLGNFSIAMFVLIPLMALLLMLFYYKSKIPFVAHLIHSLQLHTFSFLIYSMALLLIHYTSVPGTPIFAFLISVIYFFFSFKRVYGKSNFSSFLRLAGVGVLYYIIWGIILSLGVVVSFLLF